MVPAQGRDDAGGLSASTHAPSSLRTQGPITTGVHCCAEQWHQRARREPSVVMGPGSRPGRRWSFQRFNTRAVVPANAGTHNHRRLSLRGAVAPACPTRTIGGYGSRLKAGTTLEFLALSAQPRAAIQPRQIAVIILRRLRAHDGVAEAGVLACGMIDVFADRARQQL